MAVGLALAVSPIAAMAASGTQAGHAEPVLALRFDFYVVEGAVVTDGSGHNYTAKLDGWEIAVGRRKPAVQFAGRGSLGMSDVPQDLDPTARPLTVGAMCKPTAADGVLVSMGDSNEGFSLYLQGGVPQFAVRANGVLYRVAATEPVTLDQWVHLAGVIGPKGELSLLVNTSAVARSQGSSPAHTPAEPLVVGADPGAQVSDYSGPQHWQGLVQDVRLYWGALSREADREILGDWADRPGCGVRR
jgi:hypothetical protein